MSHNLSIQLNDHYNKFINTEINSGKFSSATDVVETALQLLEDEERKERNLMDAIELGESSGIYENFDKEKYLLELQLKYGK